jgi:hypothetical protein
MATGSGAFGTKCGFNQSGGGHYVVIAATSSASQLFEFPVTSGSGGAFTAAAPVPIAAGAASTALVAAVVAGAILRDMGRTVVVPSGNGARTFRKFQVVGNASGDSANFGVVSSVGGRVFFLETMREGQEPTGGVAPLAIARYF